MYLLQDKAGVRAAAFTLFGNLSRFGDGPSKSPFLEQIHTNLVSLLLHLNDPELEVRKVNRLVIISHETDFTNHYMGVDQLVEVVLNFDFGYCEIKTWPFITVDILALYHS